MDPDFDILTSRSLLARVVSASLGSMSTYFYLDYLNRIRYKFTGATVVYIDGCSEVVRCECLCSSDPNFLSDLHVVCDRFLKRYTLIS